MANEGIRQKNYSNILNVAKGIFIAQGIKNTTLNQIASRSGVVKKTVLNIFVSKNNLVFRCAESVWEDFYSEIDKLVLSKEFQEKNGLEQVLDLQVFRAKTYLKNPTYADLIIEMESIECKNKEERESLERYLENGAHLFSYFEKALTKGRQDSSIKLKMKREDEFAFLFFGFGSILQRMCHINQNKKLDNTIDTRSIIRSILNQMRLFLSVSDADVYQEDER